MTTAKTTTTLKDVLCLAAAARNFSAAAAIELRGPAPLGALQAQLGAWLK